MIELTNLRARLGVRPDLGGALVYWQHNGEDLLHPVIIPNLEALKQFPIAAYPLIPFSNRIKDAAFSFRNETYILTKNFSPEDHAIHGNAYAHVWNLKLLGETSMTLSFDHSPVMDAAREWPFSYHVELQYNLGPDNLGIVMSLTNTDDRTQPVGLGWHPFFFKAADTKLGFFTHSVWVTDGGDNIPSRCIASQDEWSFKTMRPIKETVLDNCYNGWEGSAFMRWPIKGRNMTMTASDVFSHLVVFIPSQHNYFAIEPATNMNDAVHHMHETDNGLKLLESGQTLKGWIRLSFSAL